MLVLSLWTKKMLLFTAIPINYNTGFTLISGELFDPIEKRFCHGSYRGDILSVLFKVNRCFYLAAFDSSHVSNSIHCIE